MLNNSEQWKAREQRQEKDPGQGKMVAVVVREDMTRRQGRGRIDGGWMESKYNLSKEGIEVSAGGKPDRWMNREVQMSYDVDIGVEKSKEWAEVCKGGRTVWVRGSRSALIFRLSDE
ncbi:hypothetical protein ASPTUDRAFT_804155 [Aspergillus tubingensis CBS 134.48]|uniref:Uncharacterized protein n=1 Tax=Aspergillus tubingensis (strain CBS 134.48) TaxID=767770 RepID=A0A1L9MW72_ASPTC|nr:hypothetical protein ASPTUDRAFT_804155 [Aspergillus tubingensis CBS 134.48]